MQIHRLKLYGSGVSHLYNRWLIHFLKHSSQGCFSRCCAFAHAFISQHVELLHSQSSIVQTERKHKEFIMGKTQRPNKWKRQYSAWVR